jgi:pectinesterase
MKRVYLLLIALMPMRFFLQDLDAKDWTVDVVVAQDGSGDYTTITEAIDNNPNDGSDYVIFIRNGTYDEKLFITENRITLLGEDRDSTIITQAILRRIFWETNDNSDWGVATINVGDYVMDLTLANLTIRNNFADLNPG